MFPNCSYAFNVYHLPGKKLLRETCLRSSNILCREAASDVLWSCLSRITARDGIRINKITHEGIITVWVCSKQGVAERTATYHK